MHFDSLKSMNVSEINWHLLANGEEAWRSILSWPRGGMLTWPGLEEAPFFCIPETIKDAPPWEGGSLT